MSIQKQSNKKDQKKIPEASKVFLSQELEDEKAASEDLDHDKKKEHTEESKKKKSTRTASEYSSDYKNHKHKFSSTEGKKEILGGMVSVIPKTTLKRIVKELLSELKPDARLTKGALDIIHEVVEYEAANLFFVANLLTKGRGVQTVNPHDLIMARHINRIGSTGLSIHTSQNAFKEIQKTEEKLEETRRERSEKAKDSKKSKEKTEKTEKTEKKDKSSKVGKIEKSEKTKTKKSK
jgi:histone H3/H4